MVRFTIVIAAALIGLSACSPPARSVTYFASNPNEADRVAAACKQGTETGDECVSASQAITERKSDQVFEQATKMTKNTPEIGRKW